MLLLSRARARALGAAGIALSLVLCFVLTACGDDGGGSGNNGTVDAGDDASPGGGDTGSTPDADVGDDRVPCSADDQCSVAEICRAGYCASGCRTDTACANGEICVQTECVMLGVGCRDDNDCTSGELCDAITGRCSIDDGSCRNDAAEPNETFAEATPLTPGQYERQLCEGDNDYYALELAYGTRLSATITFDSDKADLQLHLLDDRGEPLIRSESGSGEESVTYTTTFEGTFYLRVWASEGSDASYDLAIDFGDSNCRNDQGEPDNSLSEAQSVSAGNFNGTLCTGDEDWFTFFVPANEDIDVSVTGNTDVRLSLLDADGDEIISTDTGTLSYQAIFTSDYYLRVRPIASPGDYGLVLRIGESTGPLNCNDPREPNDGLFAASEIEAGTITGLTNCDGNDDYFSIQLEQYDILTVRIDFTSSTSDIDMRLLDPDGDQIDSSTSVSGSETVDVLAPVAGRYYVQVYTYSGDTNAYSMTVSIDEADCDDSYEPNDTLQSAVEDIDGSVSGTVCPGDVDWFAVEIDEPGTVIDVEIDWTGSYGDPVVTLLTPDNSEADSTPGYSPPDAFGGIANEAGTWHLRVNHDYGDGPAPYDLTWTLTPPPDCAADPYESNDTWGDAVALLSDVTGAVACAGEEDWYVFDVVTPGTLVTVDGTYTDVFGDVDVTIFDTDGTTQVGVGNGSSGTASAASFFVESGTYYVRVVPADDAAAVTYDLAISFDESPECIDSFEINNTPEQARPITPGTYTNLSLCSSDIDDDDYYSIELNAGDVLEVDMFFSDDEADLDLHVRNESNTSVRGSTTTSDDEHVTYEAFESGTYYIHALHWGGGDTTYDLEIAVTPFICDDDTFEDDDDVASARAAAEGTFTGVSCSGDADFYAVDLAEGDTLVAVVNRLGGEGNLNLAVYDDAEVELISADRDDDGEAIFYAADSTSTFYLAVEPEGRVSGDYRLEISVVQGVVGDVCNDSYEPNDDLASAAPIDYGLRADAGICSDSDENDFYAINVTRGDRVIVDAVSANLSTDIDLFLHADQDTTIASSATFSVHETIVATAPEDDVWYIEVEHWSGSDTSYLLNVTAEACVNDDNEPDDGPGFALPSLPGEFSGAICVEDQDWYGVLVGSEDRRLAATLTFDNDLGDLDLRLYDQDGVTPLRISDSSSSDEETISHVFPSTGLYYLVVQGGEFGQNTYDLSWELTAP